VIISDTSLFPPTIRVYIVQADPDVMMNDSGYAVAAWEGSIQVPFPDDLTFDVIISATRSSDGTWSPIQIVRIGDPIDFRPNNPAVSVNESGLAVAVWPERRGPGELLYVMASFLPFGGTWTTPVVLDAPGVPWAAFVASPAAPGLAMNDNGNAVAIWALGSDPFTDAIHAATYEPLTDLWTTVSLDSDPGNVSAFRAPEAAIDDNGNAVVVWNREYESGADTINEIASAYFTYGFGWGPTVILDSDIVNRFLGPYVVIDHLGTATAVWSKTNTGEVFSSRLPLGGTWSAPTLIGIGKFDPFSTQEAASVDDLGNVIVIIKVEDDILQSILYTVQGGWQPPENIFNDARNPAYQNIGLGSCGFALSLWLDFGISPSTRFVQGADNFALANFLLPPANFVGTRCCQKFATQTCCLASLSWDPSDCVLFYLIRRNGELIATIPAGGSTTFVDPVCSKSTTVYTLSTVNIYGIELPGVSITVP
jgi:hypothetical protein